MGQYARVRVRSARAAGLACRATRFYVCLSVSLSSLYWMTILIYYFMERFPFCLVPGTLGYDFVVFSSLSLDLRDLQKLNEAVIARIYSYFQFQICLCFELFKVMHLISLKLARPS